MSTFPDATTGHRRPPAGRNTAGIIARWLGLLGLALVLGACSAVRVAYNQASSLTYWWIDGYTDLNDAQSTQLRRDIDAFFAWHRSSELPLYVTRLQQWQQLALVDSNTDTACRQFDHVREAYLRAIDRSLEPMARLAVTLTPAQLQHLRQKQKRRGQEFEEDYVKVSAEERLDKLLERATDRYETLYGDLTSAQVKLLRDRIRQSPFDAQRINTERQRRNDDLHKVLLDLQPERQPSTAGAVAALRGWHDRVMRSPLPGFPAYSEALIRNGCEMFVALHNSTSPEQRAHAANLLKGYETDLRALLAQP